LLLKAELAGCLVSIGTEGKIKEAVAQGLEILETERADLGAVLHPASYEYNLGNARLALFEIEADGPQFVASLESFDQLVLAKNHYWKGYRLLTEKCEGIRYQLLINLGVALSHANRVVEAVHFCHRALGEAPELGMAHNKLALALIGLNRISGGFSQKLLWTIAEEFQICARSLDAPLPVRTFSQRQASYFRSHPTIKSVTVDEINEELKTTALEAERHSRYRRFCLVQGLALCEHALYCPCAGARHDDLMLATASQPLSGDFVPRMELVLNRLKAEFGWARLQYFHSIMYESDWNLHELEITYTELFEGEDTSVRTELLRSSFRQCFGILDKIAAALCDVFELAEPHENIYFDSFWKPRSRRSGFDRWAKLMKLPFNFGLVALYNIATDLNQVSGEWRDLKLWRNSLEHRTLLLMEDDVPEIDPFSVLTGKSSPLLVTYSEFEERTLHLLQMTCSAIFSFVCCLRQRASEARSSETGIAVTLDHKRQADIWDQVPDEPQGVEREKKAIDFFE
jgi:hypothetical protein